MSLKQVTLGLIQMSLSKNLEENRNKALQKIRGAHSKGAKIIALPELFTTLYFPQDEKVDASHLAEPIPGPTTETLSSLARELDIILVAGSIFERDGGQFFNTAIIIDNKGQLLGKYRKIHVPQDTYFYEKNYFAPGDSGYLVVPTDLGKIAVLICYDQWFPEAARSVALQGADIIFYPTAIGTIEGVEEKEGNWCEAWTTIQRGHAIANSVYVAAINRVGQEKRLHFWGGSFISSPFGELLAQAGDQEEILFTSCDLSQGREIRKDWGFFRNRRPETYQAITKK
ncbi:MAG: hypothetical protein A3B79_06325 [Deltaproteobacteria bacterium RIFCSPHIGHO2_02_FULL_50_15]|nr:MAG: hypothetical protein A3B79_06325 [Deltaproteobacteria bacterium RIFCSPHIGHO2_02_FULL_50_15]